MRSLLFLLVCARAARPSEAIPVVRTAPVLRKCRRVTGERLEEGTLGFEFMVRKRSCTRGPVDSSKAARGLRRSCSDNRPPFVFRVGAHFFLSRSPGGIRCCSCASAALCLPDS